MKLYSFILIMAFSIVSSHGLTLEELNVSFRAAMLKQHEIKDQEIEKLNQGYLRALNKTKESFQKSGDLDRALLLKNEIEMVTQKTWPLPALPDHLERKVGSARNTYLRSYLGIQRKWAAGVTKITEKMQKTLNSKMTALTKAGNLEEAQKAKARSAKRFAK